MSLTAVDSLKAKIALTKVQVAGAEARIAEAQQAVDNCVIRARSTASRFPKTRKSAK